MPALISQAGPLLDEDTIDDILYLARIGDLDGLKSSIAGASAQHQGTPALRILHAARNHVTGNGVAHLAAANGHLDVLKYVQESDVGETSEMSRDSRPSLALEDADQALSRSLLTCQNFSGSTPLHYASVSGALEAVKMLVNTLLSCNPILIESFIRAKNNAGKTAVYDAECANKDHVVGFLLGALGDSNAISNISGERDHSSSIEEGEISAQDIAEETEDLKLEDR